MKNSLSLLSVGNHFEKNILPIIDNIDYLNVAGLFTRNEANRRKFCSRLQCFEYNSVDELLDDPASSHVYISSPNSIHFNQIKGCLNAKKNVLVEKPAITDIQDYKELKDLAVKNNVFFMEAFMYRFHNQFSALQEIINTQKYGCIKRADIIFGFPHLQKDNFRYSKTLKGGALLDAGAYTLSCARELFTQNPKLIGSKIDFDLNYDVDTGGSALLDFHEFCVNCSWFFGASYQNEVRIWFEDGILLANPFFSKPKNIEPKIQVYKNYQERDQHFFTDNDHFKDMFSYFLNCDETQKKSEMEKVFLNIQLLEDVYSFSAHK